VDNEEKLKEIMAHSYSGNKTSILKLLKGFFYFYGYQYHQLPLSHRTISIRTGHFVETPPSSLTLLYSIESPFVTEIDSGRKMATDSDSAFFTLLRMKEACQLMEVVNIDELFKVNL